MHKYENEINKFKQNLEDMISKLKKIIENINIIYNINNNLLNNYKNIKRNYRLLLNLHYMNEYLENEINYIKDKYNIVDLYKIYLNRKLIPKWILVIFSMLIPFFLINYD